MSALLLPAVSSPRWKSGVTLTADSLLAIESLSQESKGRIVNSSAKTENQVKGGLLLDVVIRESTAVLELLSSKNQTLLIRGDSFLILDLGLYIIDGVRRLDLKGDGLAGEGLDEDLHTTTEAEDEMEGRLLLDVVIRESAAVLELLASEDEALLIRRDALLILDLSLDIVDSV